MREAQYAFGKEKTILELEGQNIMNYTSILVITSISFLITMWLSEEFLFKTVTSKIKVTIVCIIIFLLLFMILVHYFQKIKFEIRRL